MPVTFRSMRKILGVVACTAMSGCAIVAIFALEPEQRAAMFLVPADKAVIYFYPDVAGEEAAQLTLSVDGDPVAGSGDGGFRYREVDPGKHVAGLSGADGVELVVEAGRTYFIGYAVECVASRLHKYLHPVNDAEGRARVRALVAERKRQPPTDARMAVNAPQCESAGDGTKGTAL